MLSLHYMLSNPAYEVVGLFTTIQAKDRRTVIHGLREEVLDFQAEAIGLPLQKVHLPDGCSNALYEELMAKEMQRAKEKGVTAVVFGDIHLEDIRVYREENMEKAGMEAIFPLWGKDTKQLMEEFISLGYETWMTTIDNNVLEEKLLGKSLDMDLLKELPDHVDPCGENGEFHTVVVDGPIFKQHPGTLRSVDKIVQFDRFVTIDFRVDRKKEQN